MADYIVASPFAIPGPLTGVDTVPSAPLGLEADIVDRAPAAGTAAGGWAGRAVYCRGSNVASGGQFVQIQNGSAVLLASANSAKAYPIGVAAGVLSATNLYGWVQIQGRVDYARGTNTAPTSDVPYYLCATAGYVLTNAAGGSRIQGVYGVPGQTNTVVSSAGSYQYDLNRPFVAGVTAAL